MRCYLPLQLEAGIRSGDIEGFKFVEKAQKLFFPPTIKEKDAHQGKTRESLGTVPFTEVYIPNITISLFSYLT
jgi:hypothetical protein